MLLVSFFMFLLVLLFYCDVHFLKRTKTKDEDRKTRGGER